MPTSITQLIFRESGGFAGLQRGYTTAAQALPQVPREQLQHLLQAPGPPATASSLALHMADMQIYTLELVIEAVPPLTPTQCEPPNPSMPPVRHLVVQFPASDVPDDVSALIDFLRQQAHPLR